MFGTWCFPVALLARSSVLVARCNNIPWIYHLLSRIGWVDRCFGIDSVGGGLDRSTHYVRWSE